MKARQRCLRHTAISLLSIYISILSLLSIHVHTHQSHHESHIASCTKAVHETELHYHASQEECALTEHTLSPSPLVELECINLPYITSYTLPYNECNKAVLCRSICFYHLRAPPIVKA